MRIIEQIQKYIPITNNWTISVLYLNHVYTGDIASEIDKETNTRIILYENDIPFYENLKLCCYLLKDKETAFNHFNFFIRKNEPDWMATFLWKPKRIIHKVFISKHHKPKEE